MKKSKLFWILAVLVLATFVLAGCLGKEEKQSLVQQPIPVEEEPSGDIELMGSTTVIISEVYYDTKGDDNVEEYIELYNMGTSSISVAGWTLTDNGGTYTIPSGISIASKSAITLAKNSTGFYNLFRKYPTVSGMSLAFSNTGDKLTLKNSAGSTIDFVAWESYVSGWTPYANTSYSICRKYVHKDTDGAADWFSNVVPTPGNASATGNLRVHFIDVGQGDAILVQAPTGETMMIDAGSYQIEIENKVLSYLRNMGLNKINVVVATHPHSDHIGSLDAVIRNFAIDKAYDSGYSYTSVSYTDYINALNSKGVPMYTARRGNYFNLSSDVRVDILSPTSTIVSAPADTNDVSVVVRVTYKNNSFILTGDAPQWVEKQIMSAGYTVNSEVLKVGHHGSRTASAPEFLDAVTPTSGAVILLGEGNPYGHPHVETINALNARSIKIYRQDLDGAMNSDIVMYSNGSTVAVQ